MPAPAFYVGLLKRTCVQIVLTADIHPDGKQIAIGYERRLELRRLPQWGRCHDDKVLARSLGSAAQKVMWTSPTTVLVLMSKHMVIINVWWENAELSTAAIVLADFMTYSQLKLLDNDLFAVATPNKVKLHSCKTCQMWKMYTNTYADNFFFGHGRTVTGFAGGQMTRDDGSQLDLHHPVQAACPVLGRPGEWFVATSADKLQWVQADNTVKPLVIEPCNAAVVVQGLCFLTENVLLMSLSTRTTLVLRFDPVVKTLTKTAALDGTYIGMHRPSWRVVLKLAYKVSIVRIGAEGELLKAKHHGMFA